MTKLEKLKHDIGYTKEPKICSNCKHFFSEKQAINWGICGYKEVNLRCSKYGFATKKTTTCNEHESKDK